MQVTTATKLVLFSGFNNNFYLFSHLQHSRCYSDEGKYTFKLLCILLQVIPISTGLTDIIKNLEIKTDIMETKSCTCVLIQQTPDPTSINSEHRMS